MQSENKFPSWILTNTGIKEYIRDFRRHSALIDTDWFEVRDEYVRRMSWHICVEEQIHALAYFLQYDKVAEPFAGNGHLSDRIKKKWKTMNDVTGSYKAYDIELTSSGKIHGVIQENAHNVPYSEFDSVVMCWPPYDTDDALKVAKSMSAGSALYYQGEGYGGCTANDEFFDYLESHFSREEGLSDILNEHHLKWPGIHDEWQVFTKVED